jgi:hypothetical protein
MAEWHNTGQYGPHFGTDGAGSGSSPVAGFDFSRVVPSSSDTTLF